MASNATRPDPGQVCSPHALPERNGRRRHVLSIAAGASLACLLACSATPAEQSCESECQDSEGSETGASETSSADTGSSDDGMVDLDGCSDTLASDVALRDVSIFQVVEVPVLQSQQVITPPMRTAPVVQGRAAVVRARIDVSSADGPREFAARVEFDTPSGPETFLDRRIIDDDANDAFVVDIPATAMLTDATYSVSVVECGVASTGPGSAAARFPAQGSAQLAPVQTGTIKIHLVPFEIGGFVPDTTAPVLDGFRDAVLSVYPATDVELTVGPVVPDQDGGVLDMGDLLVRLGVQQEQEDQASPDIYYYGLVTGAATRDEYCGNCPTGTSESGGGMRAGFAMGAAFADQRSEDTLIHELGHMHGLLHAPCGNPDNTDPRFPYADANITTEGYDFRTDSFVAPDQKDMMAYCYPRWVSDYHYDKLVDWVQLAQTWGGTSQSQVPQSHGEPVRCFDPPSLHAR